MKKNTLALLVFTMLACQQWANSEPAESSDIGSIEKSAGVIWDLPMLKYKIPEGTNYYTYEFGLREDGVVMWRKSETPAGPPQMATARRVPQPTTTPSPIFDDKIPPGTQEFYDEYIRGKYRKRSGLIRRRRNYQNKMELYKMELFDPEAGKVKLEGVVSQIVDTNAILVETSQMLATGVKKRIYELVILDSAKDFQPGQSLSLDVMRALSHKCEMASGELKRISAYRPWEPKPSISYEEYLEVFNQNLEDNPEIQIKSIVAYKTENLSTNDAVKKESSSEKIIVRRKELQPGTQEYYDKNVADKYSYTNGGMKKLSSYNRNKKGFWKGTGILEQILPDGRIVFRNDVKLSSGAISKEYLVIALLSSATNKPGDSFYLIIDCKSDEKESIVRADGRRITVPLFREATKEDSEIQSITFDEYMEVYRKESSEYQMADKDSTTLGNSSSLVAVIELSEKAKAGLLEYYNKHIKDNYMLIGGKMVDVRDRLTINGSTFKGTVLQIIDSENVLCDAVGVNYFGMDREYGKIVATINSTDGVKTGDELDLDVLPVGTTDCKLVDGTTKKFRHYSIPKNFITIEEYEPFYRVKLKKEAARQDPGPKIEGLISE